jgi:sugar phosphate isomerase/epimerase
MITDRRTFLSGGAALATLAATGPLFGRADAAQLGKIGLQLYTVREIFQADPVGTLEQVARVGYREVEFGGGGYDSMDPAMLRKAMDRLGLTAPSVHISYDSLLTKFDASLAMAQTLGADTVVLPYMTDPHRNEAAWTEAVANFNRFAEKLKRAGLGFVYHNHDFEFTVQPNGVSLYERLLKGRDPALVGFELDLYWLIKAKQDPKALIRRLAGQIYSYHVKDMTPSGAMAAVGAGVIDFREIFALNAIAGVKHFYVENDQAPAPYIPDITTSFKTLRTLRFNG